MRVILATVRLQLLELLRLPSFTLPMAIFPSLLYAAVGLPQGGDRTMTLLGFLAFAILGTMMFQFGVGIAATRDTPWSIYTLTVPSTGMQRAASQLLSGAVLAALFCVPLLVLGAIAGVEPPSSPLRVLTVVLALLGGAVVHGLFGIALGYWLPARGALGIANILYFPLSFLGGLFGPVTDPTLAAIRPWTPTGAWTSALWNAQDAVVDGRAILVLAGYAACFTAAALLGYRRTERTVYR